MNIVYTGAHEILKNIPYRGIELSGNGIQVTEDTNININNTSFALFKKDTILHKSESYTYIFKEDTIVKELLLEMINFSQVFEKISLLDVPITATVETTDIVKLTNEGQSETAITAGEISLRFTFQNTGVGVATLTIKIYKTGALYATLTDTVQNGITREVFGQKEIGLPFAITDDVSFRVTSDKSGNILGTTNPSILRIRRDNL